MNDDKLEHMIRENYTPVPPEGMRARVLETAFRKQQKRQRLRFTWRAVWATAIAVVIIAQADDTARNSRISRMLYPQPYVAGKPVRQYEADIRQQWQTANRQIHTLGDNGGQF